MEKNPEKLIYCSTQGKSIYFQCSYHYYQQSVTRSTMTLTRDYKLLKLCILYVLWFVLTFGCGALREEPEGAPKSRFRLKQFIWKCRGPLHTILETDPIYGAATALLPSPEFCLTSFGQLFFSTFLHHF